MSKVLLLTLQLHTCQTPDKLTNLFTYFILLISIWKIIVDIIKIHFCLLRILQFYKSQSILQLSINHDLSHFRVKFFQQEIIIKIIIIMELNVKGSIHGKYSSSTQDASSLAIWNSNERTRIERVAHEEWTRREPSVELKMNYGGMWRKICTASIGARARAHIFSHESWSAECFRSEITNALTLLLLDGQE